MKTSEHFNFSSSLHLTEYFSYFERISKGYPCFSRLFRLVPQHRIVVDCILSIPQSPVAEDML